MTVIDDYLVSLPAAERRELERLRKIIHETVPEAEEVKTYGMPGFKYQGKYLASFAALKDHLSFFPGRLPEDILPKLQQYKTSSGTIQFSLDNIIPESLVKELLLRRMRSIEAKH